MFFFSNTRIQKIPSISSFLLEESQVKQDYYVGWGRKASFEKAVFLAKQNAGRPLCVEDGFIRSLGLGKEGCPALSLVIDHQGIYFDAFQPSDLEYKIAKTESTTQNARAQLCIDQILRFGITKYNQNFSDLNIAQFQGVKNILVVDQTYGDQSIKYSGANKDRFLEMLQQAVKDHPQANIWLKTHPDTIAGKAKAHFSPEMLKAYPRVQYLHEAYNPIHLLKQMDEVYVVSSQLGFEALMCGKKVNCFGLPWYAGWGLTNDYADLSILNERRQEIRSLAHLFHCAYIQYARYILPNSHARCELEELIEILSRNIILQKQLGSSAVLYGFSPWKRKFLKQYLAFPNFKSKFQSLIRPNKDQHIIAWGKKANLLRRQGYQNVTTVEDGFIRSIGLGAKLIRPNSLVFDDIGIYYDATRPSRLEQLLNECQLNDYDIDRIQQISKKIIQSEITKYNVGETVKLNLESIKTNKLLVIGQVEDDMSIQLGGIDIKTNLALLRAVRANHPDAYIVFKPHPDVVAGLRKGNIESNEAYKYANQIETEISILNLFPEINEVHTISSLSGFEALIRGIKVVCYGMPFYAGWGLTHDRHFISRRHRKLNIYELMHSVLIQYPTYSYESKKSHLVPITSIEQILKYFDRSRLNERELKAKNRIAILSPILKKLKRL